MYLDPREVVPRRGMTGVNVDLRGDAAIGAEGSRASLEATRCLDSGGLDPMGFRKPKIQHKSHKNHKTRANNTPLGRARARAPKGGCCWLVFYCFCMIFVGLISKSSLILISLFPVPGQ